MVGWYHQLNEHEFEQTLGVGKEQGSLACCSPQGCKEDFPGGSDGKASVYNVGDLGLIPGSGRSPGEGNCNPLQYSCLENPMDGGDLYCTVHRVAKSQT